MDYVPGREGIDINENIPSLALVLAMAVFWPRCPARKALDGVVIPV